MQQKVEDMAYKDVLTQFPSDCRLVFNNALAYNDEGDPIWGYAKELRDMFDQLWTQVVGDDTPSTDKGTGGKGKESSSSDPKGKSDKKSSKDVDAKSPGPKKSESKLLLVLPNKNYVDKSDPYERPKKTDRHSDKTQTPNWDKSDPYERPKKTDRSTGHSDKTQTPNWDKPRGGDDNSSRRSDREIKKPRRDDEDEFDNTAVAGNAKRRLSAFGDNGGGGGAKSERTPGSSRVDKQSSAGKESVEQEVKVKRIKLVMSESDDKPRRDSKEHNEPLLLKFPLKKPTAKDSGVAAAEASPSKGGGSRMKDKHSSSGYDVVRDARKESKESHGKDVRMGGGGGGRDFGAGDVRKDGKHSSSKEGRNSNNRDVVDIGANSGGKARGVRESDKGTPQTQRDGSRPVHDSAGKEKGRDWRGECLKLLIRLMNSKVCACVFVCLFVCL